MAIDRINDLFAFKSFIEEQLSSGGSCLTLDEALVRWEDENQTAEERSATVEAVREALDDMRAGDMGTPAREFLAELRCKYHFHNRGLGSENPSGTRRWPTTANG
jgi:hypothetical protein